MFKPKRRTVVTGTAAAAVLLAGALAVTLLTQGTGNASADGVIRYPAGNRPLAPDFTAGSLTGKPIKFASYRGKVVVLNFWGSWCPPCRDEAPTLEVLAQQYRAEGVAFLGDDVGDTPADALAFTRSIGITYPSVSDPSYTVVQDFSRVAPVSDTPTTVVIDRAGRIVGMVLGKASYAALTTLLTAAGVNK